MPPPIEPTPAPSADPAPGLVLDTNVVLDWLVFGNPTCHPVVAAIESRRVRWWSSARLRAEFDDVMGRTALAAWQPDTIRAAATWTRLARMLPDPDPRWSSARFRCTDPDDQPFIDLALEHRARWLLSRDRAVLRLARRAAPLGLGIVTPERWCALNA